MDLTTPEFPTQSLPEAGQIYSEIIKPGQSVAVIGPSTSIVDKPALLYTCWLQRDGGTVFVVDPQWGQTTKSSADMSKEFGRVDGAPDFNGYHMKQIEVARSKGIPLSLPRWLGPESAAQKIALDDASLDTIVDHTVSVFVSGLKGTDPKIRQQRLKECYDEYHRVLKPGGTLILQTNRKEYDLKRSLFNKSLLDRVLEQSGLSIVKELEVADDFRIPIDPSVYDRWQPREYPGTESYQAAEAYFMFSRIKEQGGQYHLTLDETWSQGPDMLICKNK